MDTDPLSAVVATFGFNADVFFNGEFCGTTDFEARLGMGHLHFVREGAVRFEHGRGEALSIQGPAIVFYPKPFDHRLVVQQGSLASLFCANIVFKNRENNLIANALPDFIEIPVERSAEIRYVTEFLFRPPARGESRSRFVLDRLCDILVYEVIRHVVAHGSVSTGTLAGLADNGIGVAIAAIHREPGAAWSVDSLAAQASMSRTKFATRFRELVGMTPGRYLTDWRLAVAEGLLLQGDSVKAVADAVGFATQPSFTKAFIQKTGLSPKQWVKTKIGNERHKFKPEMRLDLEHTRKTCWL